jgi:hypothetical protein
MSRAIPPFPKYVSMAWCLVKAQGQIYLYLLPYDTRLEVFTAMKIQVVLFCVVTSCTDVVGYQRFGGPCCFHLQVDVTMQMETACSSSSCDSS